MVVLRFWGGNYHPKETNVKLQRCQIVGAVYDRPSLRSAAKFSKTGGHTRCCALEIKTTTPRHGAVSVYLFTYQ
jgi:hypothetical protein